MSALRDGRYIISSQSFKDTFETPCTYTTLQTHNHQSYDDVFYVNFILTTLLQAYIEETFLF
jgi:hypothetical protein